MLEERRGASGALRALRAASPEQSAKVVGDHPSLGVVAESRKLSKGAETRGGSHWRRQHEDAAVAPARPARWLLPGFGTEIAGGSQ